MPDTRSPEEPGLAKVIRPGHRFGPKEVNPIHRTAVSGITAFAVCPQYHAYGYEMGLKAADEKPARKIGSLVHVGLAYRYGALLPQKPEWMVYPDARTALWTVAQGDIEAGTEALRVFDAYQVQYRVEQNIWKPILVEHQFEVVMDVDGVPERYTLRIDLLAEDLRDGALVLVDHKSAYKLTRNTGYGYRADREMLTGLALCRANGYNVQRVVINAMTKERPEPRFGRFDVPISEAAYNDLGQNTLYWIRQMRAVKASHPDPKSRPKVWESCVRKYGVCVVAGTMVRTRRGWLKIEDVTDNDLVVGKDGQFHPVIAATSRDYEGDVISILPMRNSVGVTVTPEHRIFVDPVNCKPASDLQLTDSVACTWAPSDWQETVALLPFAQTKRLNPKRRDERLSADVVSAVRKLKGQLSHRCVAALYSLDPGVVRRLWGEFERRLLPTTPVLRDGRIYLRDGYKSLPEVIKIDAAFAELAGLYIAEGCAGNKLQFSFGRHETQLIARCQELVAAVLGEPSTLHRAGPVTCVWVSHGLWAHVFRAWFGGQAPEKRMPTWLETAPFDIFKHALHGWIEGDGGDRTDRPDCVQEVAYGVTSSLGLALQMWSGLSRAGLAVSVNQLAKKSTSSGMIDGRKIHRRHATYIVQIRSQALSQLASTLGLKLALPVANKLPRPPRFADRYMQAPIRKTVRKRYKGRVYDLTVHGAESFLANGIIVHNCDMWPICSDGLHRIAEFTKKW